jgi:hypothetical protein
MERSTVSLTHGQGRQEFIVVFSAAYSKSLLPLEIVQLLNRCTIGVYGM